MLTIGKLALGAAVTSDTIRYYEKEGLLTPAAKTSAGYRLYDEQAIRRLRFIKHAQQCGFSLSEIRDLLTLKENEAACCHDVRTIAIEKKLLLEHKIKALKDMSQALSELITICGDDSSPLADCPIIEALENSAVKPRFSIRPRSEGDQGVEDV